MSADARSLGAMAAVLAMLKCEKIAESYNNDPEYDTAECTLLAQTKGVHAVTEAAGDMSPFLSGFVTALAEYIYGGMATEGQFDLLVWKPNAAMSEAELTAARQRLEAFYAGHDWRLPEVTA